MSVFRVSVCMCCVCRAIMRFHKLKMEEINKIIKELWIKTYRGGGTTCTTHIVCIHSPSHTHTYGVIVCRY